MLSDESKPNDGETTETPSGAPDTAPQQAAATAASEARTDVVSGAATVETPASEASASEAAKAASAPAPANEPDDDDDARPGDMDFGKLDQFEQEQATLQEGEVVRGTVVGISERGVVIDFGYKSEGLVNPAEFTENGVISVKPGDEVAEVLVKSMETADGLPILSRADAVRMKAWDDLEKAYQEGSTVKGRVMERIKGGLRIDIDGIGAFLPGSQVDVRPVRNLDSLRNQEIEAKVIKLNRKRSNVVLSRKAVSKMRTRAEKIKRCSTSRKRSLSKVRLRI